MRDTRSTSRQQLERELLDALRRDPAALQKLKQRRTAPDPRPMAFSFLFFSGNGDGDAARQYRLVEEVARFGDARGFEAIWLPERHFHPFGGAFPNPSVLAAHLAAVTRRIRLRAGSVVAPLHHPAVVAESWAMIDQLSGGRVDLAFASGWSPADFVISPETFPHLREVWLERVETVRVLWSGETVEMADGRGEPRRVTTFPRPLQKRLNVWLAVTGRDDSFVMAGERGYNVLTMLKGISLDELARKVALYRDARRRSGHDRGQVTLMLHTCVHPDAAWVESRVREPFFRYIESGLGSHLTVANDAQSPSADVAARIAEFAYERYSRTAALFGTPQQCREMVEHARNAGVDEIACLVDFGMESADVVEGLAHLGELAASYGVQSETARIEVAGNEATSTPSADPVAVIGMGVRFPGSPDHRSFWRHLVDGDELISDIPPERQRLARGGAMGRFSRAGLIERIDDFDAALFGISPHEAAGMDPHQRVFLETVRHAIEDAGYAPESLAGTNTGVFAAVYNADYLVSASQSDREADAFAATGSAHFMVANRTSYCFDLRGPSEIVNTACSSALVAIHRAVRAIRSGECDTAIAGGVSLLLGLDRLELLDRFGILSPEGKCRPFDRDTTGQVIGEGAGALFLKRLSAATRDGDQILGVILGSAVNHPGNRSGSPTMPDAESQASVVRKACADAKVAVDSIGYIEAHGAGGYGDVVELVAFSRAWNGLGDGGGIRCRIGSVKPNIGFLEAAGGVSQLVKVLLMLRSESFVPTLNHASLPDEAVFEQSPFEIVTRGAKWERRDGQPRRAGVHSYGLGGTNAHILLQEWPAPSISDDSGAAQLLTLSARTPAALRRAAEALAVFLRGDEPASLADIAYTLQTGRTAFQHRVAVLSHDRAGAAGLLDTWLRGEGAAGIITGDAPLPRPSAGARRISLPGYPFGEDDAIAPAAPHAVHWTVSATDPTIRDHQVHGAPIVPAAVLLDGVLAAAERAGLGAINAIDDVFWPQPCSVAGRERELAVRWAAAGTEPSRFFSLESNGGGNAFVHCTGHLRRSAAIDAPLPAVDRLIASAKLHVRGDDLYTNRGSAVVFGPSFRTIRDAWLLDDGAVLAHVISDGPANGSSRPAPLILDGAFQACSLLAGGDRSGVYLPYSLGSFTIGPAAHNGDCWVHARLRVASGSEMRCDLLLFARNEPLAAIRDFCLRQMSAQQSREVSILEAVAAGTLGIDEAEASLAGGDAEAAIVANLAEVVGHPDDVAVHLTDGGRWLLRGHASAERNDRSARTTIHAGRDDLRTLVEGRSDPTVMQVQRTLRIESADPVLERELGALLFRHHNVHHFNRLPSHVLTEVYRTGETGDGERRSIYPWSISAEAGMYLYDLAMRSRSARTLEIGMAYGLATLFLAQALRDGGGLRHVAIDPCQTSDFLGIGMANVRAAGLTDLVDLMEEEDVRALPKLEANGSRFGLVFIDGLHMFDYAMLDFFYADRLLETGGYMIFDDRPLPQIQRVIDFVLANLAYRSVDGAPARLAVLQKSGDDERSLLNPNHYREF